MTPFFPDPARFTCRALLPLAAALAFLSCGGDSTAPQGAAKYLVSFTPTDPIAGDQLAVVAQLVDGSGNKMALAGRVVTWSSSSGGTFSPAKTTTIADGSARTTFVTAGLVGVKSQITLSDDAGTTGSSAQFLIGTGPPASYTIALSNKTPAPGSTILISAQLADRNGNPLPGAGREVTFVVTGGGGPLSSQTAMTNTNGSATVSFTVGAVAKVTYQVGVIEGTLRGGLTAITTTVGPAAQYLVTASEIDPPAGGPVAIAAQLVDAYSNRIAAGGLLVSWSASGSGGSFSSGSSITGNDGAATIVFTPGAVAGATYTVSATGSDGVRGNSPAITTQPQVSLATIATGSYSASVCGTSPTGTGWCWGVNSKGQLGNGTTVSRSLPGRVAGNVNIASVTVGKDFACGLTPLGAAYCWGNNSSGQLGDDSFTSRTQPVAVSSTLTFQSVSAGGTHTCGLATGGDLYCWGYNGSGQLGDGTNGLGSKTPVKVAGGLSFVAVSAGESHTCAISASGAAYCWGANFSGQIGDNSTIARVLPVAVVGGVIFASLSAGRAHTCGINNSGTGYCWGDNGYGQLGLGTAGAPRTAPFAISGGLKLSAITAGWIHSCAITSQSIAYCWGANDTGELGTGNYTRSYFPVAVGTTLLFKSITAGGIDSNAGFDYYYSRLVSRSCGVTLAGTAYCWGSNENGELGYGRAISGSASPVKVAGQL